MFGQSWKPNGLKPFGHESGLNHWFFVSLINCFPPAFLEPYRSICFHVTTAIKTSPELIFSAAAPVGWSTDYHAQDEVGVGGVSCS